MSRLGPCAAALLCCLSCTSPEPPAREPAKRTTAAAELVTSAPEPAKPMQRPAALAWELGPRADDHHVGQHLEELRRLRRLIPELVEEIETLRGLRFLRPVPVVAYSPQHAEQIKHRAPRHALYRTMDFESPVMEALGLRTQPFVPEIPEEPVAFTLAYFDPEADEVVITPGAFRGNGNPNHPLNRAGRESILQHELVHALQAQHYPELFCEHADPTRAYLITTLLEGEAVYLAGFRSARVLERFAKVRPYEERLDPTAHERWRTRDALAKLTEIQAALGGEQPPNGERVDLYPYYYRVDPYVRGPWLIHALRAFGGWDTVDAVFRDPPLDTAQVLHPGLPPTSPLELGDCARALGRGWRLRSATTVGERWLQVFFEEHSGFPQLRACTGWAGDRAQLYQGPNGQQAVRWRLRWARESDAWEFVAALEALPRPLGPELTPPAEGELAEVGRKLREGLNQIQVGQHQRLLPPTLRDLRVIRDGRQVTLIAAAEPEIGRRLERAP